MWKEIQKHGLPKKSGIYLTCSVMEGRNMPSDIQDAICYFDVKAKAKGNTPWQHSSGFYDNGITHWCGQLPEPIIDDIEG